MKLSALILISLAALPILAQQTQDTTAQAGNSGFFNPFTLASGLLERNFVNIFAFGNAAYDSDAEALNTGQVSGSGGFNVGGGIEASHVWRDAQFGISYNIGYSNYNSPFFLSGTNQNLVLGYTKRFTRRWALSLSEAAGSYLYGTPFYSYGATNTTPLVTNPFSPETRFASSAVSLTYRQTRRLSYVLSGSFSLYRYTGPGGIGSDDVGASFSAQYLLTARTTVGATYSYSDFIFTKSAGYDHLNGIFATLSHQFHGQWSAFVSAGADRSVAAGTFAVPVTILTGQQQLLSGYEVGTYRNVQYIPSFQGSVTHAYRHSRISLDAGQGISSGNGIYLATKDRYFGGYYSYNTRKSVFALGGGYSNLSSIANSVSSTYSSENFTLSYGYNLMRYISANARYDFINYGSVSPYPSRHDNHIAFGISFSSKSIPLTLF